MIAFKSLKPHGYGRVILENKVVEVVEEIHTSKSEKLIELCNSGIMLVNKSIFLNLFNKLNLEKLKKRDI